MVQHCSTTVDAKKLTTSNSLQLKRKVTSTDLENGLGNKSSMPRSDGQMFVAPGMLARGRGRKLHELYASKRHNTSFPEKGANSKGYVESRASISKSTGGSLMRQSSTTDNSGHGDPFIPMRHFSSSSDHGFPPSALVHDDDVSNYGIDADNDDSDSASFSENDAISSSEDEDLHNPQRAYNFTSALGESQAVTKPTQVEHDNAIGTLQDEEEINDGGVSKKRKADKRGGKTRGRNKCKELAKLKPGEKLPIEFYRNRAVGENYDVFVRHLGIIVRDTNICPLRVHRWKDIDDRQLEHMWQAVTNVFSNDDMEVYREHVLQHMHELWTNWRADLKRYNITKPGRSLRQALDYVPSGLDKHEWEWLVKEIYSKDPHKKASARNSANRSCYKKDRLHRTGSKPYRQVAWELGAKSGNEPSFLQMFRETHKKGTEFATPEIAQKYDEIREVMEKDSSLSQMEIAQKVFKSKSRSQVIGLGGGVKPKDVRGSCSTRAELEVELNATRKKNEVLTDRLATVEAENEKLQNRVESVESEMMKIKDLVFQQFNTRPPFIERDGHEITDT